MMAIGSLRSTSDGRRRLSLVRWPSVCVLVSIESLGLQSQWTRVTNDIQFRAWMNQWRFQIPIKQAAVSPAPLPIEPCHQVQTADIFSVLQQIYLVSRCYIAGHVRAL